ncbi:MAG: FKBP-type peptidyl-prolyl cis-trans isomerase [Planctomycetota bacterium]
MFERLTGTGRGLTALGVMGWVTVGVSPAWADGHEAAEAPAPAEAAVETAEAVEPAAEATPDDGFANDVDRVSYAIGRDIGTNFSSQNIEVNVDVMVEALRASYAGEETRMTDEQAMSAIQTFQQQMQMKQMEAMMKQQEEALAKNTEEAELFLAANKDKEGVQVTESGLQYVISEQGDGETPGPEDRVTVHYKGSLIDGTVFDSSYDRGEPATFPVGGVIPGFAEGLQLMPVGSKGKLFIPGDIAYGMQGGPGGPNATLIFDVEVLGVESPEPAAAGDELPALGD